MLRKYGSIPVQEEVGFPRHEKVNSFSLDDIYLRSKFDICLKHLSSIESL
jgi:hypothetical protein